MDNHDNSVILPLIKMTEEIPDYKLPMSFSYGVHHPKYMLVGISGGRLGCLQTGVPFTKDMSGRLLQRVLGRLRYSRSDEYSEKPELSNVYITNLVKGKILDSNGMNRTPNNKEIRYWMGDMLDEIDRRIQPQYVVAIGSVVYDYLKDEKIGPEVLLVKHPSWYGRFGALNEDSNSWKDMLEEYTKVFGMNG